MFFFCFLFSVLLFLPTLLYYTSVARNFLSAVFVFHNLEQPCFLPFPFALYINLIPFLIFPANRGCVSLPLFPLSFTPSFPPSSSPSHPSRVSELCVYFYSSLYYAVVLKFRPRLWKCWGRTIYESCFFFKRFFWNAEVKRIGGGGDGGEGEAWGVEMKKKNKGKRTGRERVLSGEEE